MRLKTKKPTGELLEANARGRDGFKLVATLGVQRETIKSGTTVESTVFLNLTERC